MNSFEGVYIGVKGYYELLDPFSNLITQSIIHECIAVRNITELVASGVDVLNTIYVANGLSEKEYDLAIELNTRIITLQNESGQTYLAPSNYFKGFPLTSGMPYCDITLGVALGPLPETKDLAALTESISNIVKDYLGITPEIQPIQTSASMVISHDDHDSIEVARNAIITQSTTDSSKLIEANRKLELAYTTINKLEEFIKYKLT